MGSGLVGIEGRPTGNTFRPPPGFMDGDPSELGGGPPLRRSNGEFAVHHLGARHHLGIIHGPGII